MKHFISSSVRNFALCPNCRAWYMATCINVCDDVTLPGDGPADVGGDAGLLGECVQQLCDEEGHVLALHRQVGQDLADAAYGPRSRVLHRRTAVP